MTLDANFALVLAYGFLMGFASAMVALGWHFRRVERRNQRRDYCQGFVDASLNRRPRFTCFRHMMKETSQ